MGNAPTKEEDRQSQSPPQQTNEPDAVMARHNDNDAGGEAAPRLPSFSRQSSTNPAVTGRVKKRGRGGSSSLPPAVGRGRNAARLEFASSSDEDSSHGRRASKRAKNTRRVGNGNANKRRTSLPAKVVIDVEENRQVPKGVDRNRDLVGSRKPAAKEDPAAVVSSSEKPRCAKEDRLRSEGAASDQPASRSVETVRESEGSPLDLNAADDDAQRAKKKIEELEGQIASQKKEHEACESVRVSLRSSVDSLTQTNGEQAGKIKALEQQLVVYQERLTTQEKSNVTLEERLKSLQQSNVELASNAKQLKDQLAESQTQHDDELTATKAELAKMRQDHAKELSAERSKCQHQKDEINRLERCLAGESIMSEKCAKLQEENRTLEDQLSSHRQMQQATASSHSDQIAKLQAELRRERSTHLSYAELKRRSAKLEEDNERLMEELQQKDDENETRREECRAREKVLTASVGVLEAEKNEMAHRLTAEQTKASRHAEEASDLRDRLRRAEEDRESAEKARAREVDSLTQEYDQRIAEIQSANLKEQQALRDEKRSLEALFG